MVSLAGPVTCTLLLWASSAAGYLMSLAPGRPHHRHREGNGMCPDVATPCVKDTRQEDDQLMLSSECRPSYSSPVSDLELISHMFMLASTYPHFSMFVCHSIFSEIEKALPRTLH